jgi:hypothetical protein
VGEGVKFQAGRENQNTKNVLIQLKQLHLWGTEGLGKEYTANAALCQAT